MSEPSVARAVSEFYGRYAGGRDVDAAILAILRDAGQDLGSLTPDDLAPFDHLHNGGKEATLGLLRLADLGGVQSVLDVGGGLGGPARTLAQALGCRVTVLDVSDAFCRAGAALTRLVGLDDRVTFQQGSATQMPFPDATFDAVWMQNATMNIPDKVRLVSEIHRVLRPGGRLALQDILAGPVQPIHFPVPWADDASISYLVTPEAMRALLAEAGFAEVTWLDVTGELRDMARRAAEARARAASSEQRPDGSPGSFHRQAMRNMARNVEEGRVVTVWGVFDRNGEEAMRDA